MSNFDTAVFRYSEDGPGAYTIMVIRGKANRLMRKEGYRGFHIYLNLGGHIQYADYDPRRFARQFTASDDDTLLDILLSIESGNISLDAVDGCEFNEMGWQKDGL